MTNDKDSAVLAERVERVTKWLDGGCSTWGTPMQDIREILNALRQPTQSDAEITEADCNVAEYIAGDRARDLDYQVVAYHRKWSVLEERAKIVAWLMREEDDYPSGKYSGFAAIIREEIEAGEHLK